MNNNWVYSNTKDNKARFLLGEKGANTLICIGINPSTAIPGDLDPTLSTVKRFSSDLGYDSWLMLNVYPQRATNPKNIDMVLNNEFHNENMKQISSVLKSGKHDIWAAWGASIIKRKYLFLCLNDIYHLTNKYSINWYSLGEKTKAGHPHHPLYLKKTCKLDKFDIDTYIKKHSV